MSEILIRFVRGTGIDSKIIEHRTRSWCSHMEALPFGSDLTFGAMLVGGVDFRRLNDRAYKKASRTEIWHLPCTEQQHHVFWNFLLDQSGKPYDWRAICAFGMGERDWENPDAWFCSELQMSALKKSRLWNPQGESHVDRIDPNMGYLVVTSLPGAYI